MYRIIPCCLNKSHPFYFIREWIKLNTYKNVVYVPNIPLFMCIIFGHQIIGYEINHIFARKIHKIFFQILNFKFITSVLLIFIINISYGIEFSSSIGPSLGYWTTIYICSLAAFTYYGSIPHILASSHCSQKVHSLYPRFLHLSFRSFSFQ